MDDLGETLHLGNFGAAYCTVHVADLRAGSAPGTRLGVTAAIDGAVDGYNVPPPS